MAASAKRSGRVNRRSQILKAAEKLMHSRGLTGVTTRQISEEVGCSEGALYFHFKGRLDLLLAMLEESLPDMLGPLQTLRESVGRNTPHANLAAALGGIFKFHRRVLPATGGLFAEPELLVAYRESLARQGKGPHLSMAALADYITAEQILGRIDSGADPKLAAYLLMSSSFFRAFMEQFSGRSIQPSWDQFAKQLITMVAPQTAPKRPSLLAHPGRKPATNRPRSRTTTEPRPHQQGNRRRPRTVRKSLDLSAKPENQH